MKTKQTGYVFITLGNKSQDSVKTEENRLPSISLLEDTEESLDAQS